MKTINFPYIAGALGLFLLMVVTRGSDTSSEGITALPLLSLLIINECAFFLTAAGSYIGLKNIGTAVIEKKHKALYAVTIALCLLLTVLFILLGIKLWPL